MDIANDGDAVTEAGWTKWPLALLAGSMVIACLLWNVEAPTRLGKAILVEQYMSLQLGLALTILYLRFGWRGQEIARPDSIGLAVAALAFASLLFGAVYFNWMLNEQYYRPWQITVFGAVVTVATMEGIRRRTGWMLFTIIGLFLVYALFADKVPGRLIGKEMSPVRLVQYVGFDTSAAFSTPLLVGSTIVILFVFFGQLLFAAGGGAFFTDLAMAATGKSRGGSAKIAVVGSAMFGSISGSAVSNVVTTGVITIPLMKRGGYSARDAGAVEAVASTGGQLTPPIMGAVAFLMAEFLELPYIAVASAALIPAIFYYISVFIQVDLIAGRDGIAAPDEDRMTFARVMAEGWHFVVPFAVLLGALFWYRYDPEDSAMLASLAIVVVGFLRPYRGARLTVRSLAKVFSDTGMSVVDLILIVAAAGFVIGVLNVTGLGFALTLVLVDAVGQNVLLLMAISAVICIVLGMGMPTAGVYVLLAALVAPSLVRAGISPIAAHLFILYFGMMSMITPPVALAAFAAAAISKADALSTGLAAMRVGWVAFLMPFAFVSTPALLMDGTWGQIALVCGQATVGIAAISAAMVGFWGRRLTLSMRGALAVLGVATMPVAFLPLDPALRLAAGAVSIAILTALFILGPRADAPTPITKGRIS